MATTDIDSAIRSRAYEFWQADGERHGRDLDHWLRAEAEIRGIPAPAQAPVKTPVRALTRKALRKPAARAKANA